MSVILSFALAFAVSSSPAQAAGSRSDEIVIQGNKLEERASDYVGKVLPIFPGAQFGRFEEPICPTVVGLPQPLGKEVVDRIRQVAQAANFDVAAETCTPNLFLITTQDKKVMIDTLRKERPHYLTGLGADRLKRLAHSERPFAAWQVSEVMGADGMPIGKGQSFPKTNPNGRFAGDFPVVRTTVSPSRLRGATKPRVLSSIIIIETHALNDMTIRQLADFALVRAMGPTADAGDLAPTTSILSLFNPDVTPADGPQSVTWWDVAFLKSLVNTRSDSYANIQQSQIRSQMIREVKKTRTAGQ